MGQGVANERFKVMSDSWIDLVMENNVHNLNHLQYKVPFFVYKRGSLIKVCSWDCCRCLIFFSFYMMLRKGKKRQ